MAWFGSQVRNVVLGALVGTFGTLTSAQGVEPASPSAISAAPPVDSFHELETKYIFGFTAGADIGVPGERAIDLETTSAFQKRRGHYTAIEQEVEFEGVPTDFFSYELSVHGSQHSIGGTRGLDNLSRFGFSGLSTDLRFAILHRGPESPVGLTFRVSPEWERIDGGSGQYTRTFGSAFSLIADTEVIPNRLYAALNVGYAPEIAKADAEPSWQRASSVAATGALAYRVLPRVTLGGELEYYRDFDGLLFRTFAGHALFAGPTLHVQINAKSMLAAAFSTQAAGQAAGERRALDLENFERYHAKLRFEYEF